MRLHTRLHITQYKQETLHNEAKHTAEDTQNEEEFKQIRPKCQQISALALVHVSELLSIMSTKCGWGRRANKPYVDSGFDSGFAINLSLIAQT